MLVLWNSLFGTRANFQQKSVGCDFSVANSFFWGGMFVDLDSHSIKLKSNSVFFVVLLCLPSFTLNTDSKPNQTDKLSVQLCSAPNCDDGIFCCMGCARKTKIKNLKHLLLETPLNFIPFDRIRIYGLNSLNLAIQWKLFILAPLLHGCCLCVCVRAWLVFASIENDLNAFNEKSM